MRHLLLIGFILFSLPIFSQLKISQNCASDITDIISTLEDNNGKITDEILLLYPINKIQNEYYISIVTTVDDDFNSNQLIDENIIFGSRIGDIVSLKFPIQNLENVYTIPGITSLKIAGKIKPFLDRVLTDTRVDSVHAGFNLPEAYTGENVLIGVTDWGFDYTSPMFYDTLLQNTRILAAWDQFKNSGPTPENMSYGTEFSTPEMLFDAGSDTSNIYSYSTHGTHVSGIAGGSGAGTAYRGVAFESQFLFTTFLVDEGSVLDAWQWMYDKSEEENKRLVINMSWGLYHMGPNDGTSLLSQALDSYTDLGVIFVTSGGNNGSVNFHIEKVYSEDTLSTLVNFYSSSSLASLWGQSIHAWGETGSEFSASIKILDNSNQVVAQSPWYSTSSTSEYIEDYFILGASDTIYYNLSMDALYPTNNKPQMRLRVKKPASIYKVVLNSTAASGTVHYWNLTELSNDVGNWGMPFSSLGAGYTSGNDEYGIGTPACSNSAITVAAYKSEYLSLGGSIFGGQLANFSSKGPLVTGNLKPDIAAPGVTVGSSISSFTDASYTAIDQVTFNGRNYPFAEFSGTSMSSPVVAGIIALILDANPYLSPEQMKEVLLTTAREDEDTGNLDDEGDVQWGFGKITANIAILAALDMVGVDEISEELSWTIYPNPSTNQLNISGLDEGVSSIEIINMNGRTCANFDNKSNLQFDLPAGIYWVRIIRNNKVEQQKFLVTK